MAPPRPAAARAGAPVGHRASSGPSRPSQTHPTDAAALLDSWLGTQAINLHRHAASLRSFAPGEFGTGPVAPGPGHVRAVNDFIGGLRRNLEASAAQVGEAVRLAQREPTRAHLEEVLKRKTAASLRVLYVEGIWDFYFDLFVQRLSRFGERLHAVDRIASSCYRAVFVPPTGPGRPAPPALLPLSYADTGFSPATFRRGVPLARLRHHPNLFPLITLPQHRLDNVWALSSVLHEVSHNLQADLGLWEVMPRLLKDAVTREARLPEQVGDVWARWHKELTADLFALLLGGPSAVESLMDVVGRSRPATVTFDPGGVHPTPYLRVLLSLVLLRRLGHRDLASGLETAWRRLYPDVGTADIPADVLRSFPRAAECAVDVVCFRPHPQLGGKRLAELIPYGAAEQAQVEDAARRLARGVDTGRIPVRLMVSAARHALDHRLAPAPVITEHFYRVLGRH